MAEFSANPYKLVDEAQLELQEHADPGPVPKVGQRAALPHGGARYVAPGVEDIQPVDEEVGAESELTKPIVEAIDRGLRPLKIAAGLTAVVAAKSLWDWYQGR